MKKSITLSSPANETDEHFLLKQYAVAWLKASGCKFAGAEVENGVTTVSSGRGTAKIADAVGVKIERRTRYNEASRKWDIEETNYTVKVIEVKVSRADYANGFCRNGHFVYVLTTPGILAPNELPTGIGLLEADPEKLRFWPRTCDIDGITVRRRPRRQKLDAVVETDEAFATRMIERIADRLTINAVWSNPWIERAKHPAEVFAESAGTKGVIG